MTRRRNPELSFSLFAFQDIITAVTGISLLITMILALALITSKRVKSDVVTPNNEMETLRSEIEGLEKQIDLAQSELAADAKDISFMPMTKEDLRIAIQANETFINSTDSEIESLKIELEKLEGIDLDELRQRVNERQDAVDKQIAENKQTEDQLQDELNHVQEKLAELKTDRRFFFNPPEGLTKKPWVVEIFGNRVAVAPADQSENSSEFPSPSDFLSSLREYDSQEDYFVLFAHPSGIKAFSSISNGLTARRFDFGTDVLGRNQFIVGEQ